MSIYINSRNRPTHLLKTIPRWLRYADGLPITIVTEEDQVDQYQSVLRGLGVQRQVSVYALNESDQGLGYSRQQTIGHSFDLDLRSIIVSDDDIAPSSPVAPMLEFAQGESVLGCGVTTSYHGLLMGNEFLRSHNEPVLCPSGWGFRMYALNVWNTVAIGNFDRDIPCLCEDAELMRTGIAVLGVPWYVHTACSAVSIGKRFEEGGMLGLMGDVDTLEEVQRDVHKLVYQRWPEYISKPPKKYRMAWVKMLDKYIPEWRKSSALHGGSL